MLSERDKKAIIEAQGEKTKFIKLRIKLDKALKLTSTKANNRFDQPFKSMWVYNTSSDDVEFNVKFNHPFDKGDTLKLVKNQVVNHEFKVLNVFFEAPAQPNEWIDIQFGIDDHIVPGNINLLVGGVVDLKQMTIGGITVPMDDDNYIVGYGGTTAAFSESVIKDIFGQTIEAAAGKKLKIVAFDAYLDGARGTVTIKGHDGAATYTTIGGNVEVVGGMKNEIDARDGAWETSGALTQFSFFSLFSAPTTNIRYKILIQILDA